MRFRKLAHPLLVLFAVVALSHLALATDHQPPYDPRPLMEAADASAGAPFTFAVFGDSYANPPLGGLLEMVAARKPTFAVTTGDMVSNGSDEAQWRTLSDRAGWFLSSIATWPVIGNHELAGAPGEGRAHFTSFYHLPKQSYSFIFRNSKFVVVGYESQAGQLAFLRAELADRAKYDNVFVFRHPPFFTVGSKSTSEVPNRATEITKLLTQRHVTAVIAGHDHSYYRTKREGVTYLIAGAAGAGLYDLRRISERRPTDSYMGVIGDRFVLHTPKGMNESVLRTASSEDDWLFAVFVHVDGKHVTAETISKNGDVWERFPL